MAAGVRRVAGCHAVEGVGQDVKNAGGRPAGSISAGWFLREFVDGFPWAHLDIAGTAYTDRDDPARVKGPTGVGVRLFTEFVLGRAGKEEQRAGKGER